MVGKTPLNVVATCLYPTFNLKMVSANSHGYFTNFQSKIIVVMAHLVCSGMFLPHFPTRTHTNTISNNNFDCHVFFVRFFFSFVTEGGRIKLFSFLTSRRFSFKLRK